MYRSFYYFSLDWPRLTDGAPALVDSLGNLELVLLFLRFGPLFLSQFLLFGELMVIGLEFLQLLLFLQGHVVLHHTSNSCHCVGLFGVGALLIDVEIFDVLLLFNLLLNPLFLDLGVFCLSFGVF